MRIVHNAKLLREADDAPSFTAVALDDETQEVVMLVDKDDGTDLVGRRIKRDWAWRHGYPLVQIFPGTSKDEAARLIRRMYDDVKSGKWQRRYKSKKEANRKRWQEKQARRRERERADEARRRQQQEEEASESLLFSAFVLEEQAPSEDAFSLI